MDYELSLKPNPDAVIEANVVTKSANVNDRRSLAKATLCQICSKKGHLSCCPPTHGRQLSSSGLTSSKAPSANLVTTRGAMSMWYPDSRATSHITQSSENLQILFPYNGFNSVVTANGIPMTISHSRKSNASCEGTKFVLDLLLVPESSRNLLSVNRFCSGNHVHVEFDKQRVRIRDLATEKVLTEGEEKDGLYQLPLRIHKSPEALLGDRVPSTLWRYRLGHLHDQAVKDLVKNDLISSSCKST